MLHTNNPSLNTTLVCSVWLKNSATFRRPAKLCDTFYRYRAQTDEGGVDMLINRSCRPLILRIAPMMLLSRLSLIMPLLFPLMDSTGGKSSSRGYLRGYPLGPGSKRSNIR